MSISCSLSARSSGAWSRDVAVETAPDVDGRRSTAPCDQSRSRHGDARPGPPAAVTTQPPTQPGRPGHEHRTVHARRPASRPTSSRERCRSHRLSSSAQVAEGVHALPEAVVPVGHQLAFAASRSSGSALEAVVVAGDVVEDPRLEDEEAAVDPALADLRLLGELDDPVAVEAPGRRTGPAAAPR